MDSGLRLISDAFNFIPFLVVELVKWTISLLISHVFCM